MMLRTGAWWLFLLCCCPYLEAKEAPSSRRLIDEIVLPAMQKNGVPGVAIALYENHTGSVICYGVMNLTNRAPVNPETLFELASITKIFTSTDLALLAKRGVLHLDDPVTEYLPGIDRSRGAKCKVFAT